MVVNEELLKNIKDICNRNLKEEKGYSARVEDFLGRVLEGERAEISKQILFEASRVGNVDIVRYMTSKYSFNNDVLLEALGCAGSYYDIGMALVDKVDSAKALDFKDQNLGKKHNDIKAFMERAIKEKDNPSLSAMQPFLYRHNSVARELVLKTMTEEEKKSFTEARDNFVKKNTEKSDLLSSILYVLSFGKYTYKLSDGVCKGLKTANGQEAAKKEQKKAPGETVENSQAARAGPGAEVGGVQSAANEGRKKDTRTVKKFRISS